MIFLERKKLFGLTATKGAELILSFFLKRPKGTDIGLEIKERGGGLTTPNQKGCSAHRTKKHADSGFVQRRTLLMLRVRHGMISDRTTPPDAETRPRRMPTFLGFFQKQHTISSAAHCNETVAHFRKYHSAKKKQPQQIHVWGGGIFLEKNCLASLQRKERS